ncbi:MAG: HD-GYP domain-containing protein [Clostridia bacterium]|nr:HD-GYP domain-containing protein [Clostridia bacterium]
MIKMQLNTVKNGMIIGEDIYNNYDVLIIASGTVITDKIFQQIERLGLDEVHIIEKDVNGDNQIVIIKDDIQNLYENTVESFKNLFNSIKFGKQIISEEVEEILAPMLMEVKHNPSLAKKLWQIEACDEYTYDHSVTVSMASALLGKWMNMTDKQINELAIAGLLHDIGKCNIPDEILKKPDRLTDEEFKVMKTHATLGYLLVKNSKDLSNEIIEGVYQHHEKFDGNGYPNKLVGEDIHIYGRLIAIADVYSAMTSNRVYRKKMSPFLVAKLVTEYSFGYLDPVAVNIFLQNVGNFYVGTLVKLNNGMIGQVVMVNKLDPYRPLVKVNNDYIDLSKHYEIEIDSLID